MTIDRSSLPLLEKLEKLREAGRKLAYAGRFEKALEIYSEALDLAEKHGDPDGVDLAICNRCAILLRLNRGAEAISKLQMVLMRSRKPEHRHLAAVNISDYFDLKRDFKKGIFYARLSVENAQQTDRIDLALQGHNRLANALLSDSYFEEALVHYKRALELAPAEATLYRSVFQTNLGYCLTMSERPDDALPLLFAARRGLRSVASPQQSASAHRLHSNASVRLRVSLGCTYIELERFRYARLHSLAALAVAENAGDLSMTEKALYLLGEVEKLDGNQDAAFSYFRRLQREFHTEDPALLDLLMQVNTHKLINLLV